MSISHACCGKIHVEDLRVGTWRELGADEIKWQKT